MTELFPISSTSYRCTFYNLFNKNSHRLQYTIIFFLTIQDSTNDKQVSSNGTTNQILLTFPQSDTDQGINNYDLNSTLNQIQLERVINSQFENINDNLGNINVQNISNTAFPTTQYIYNIKQTNESNDKKVPGRPRKDGQPVNSKLTVSILFLLIAYNIFIKNIKYNFKLLNRWQSVIFVVRCVEAV